MRFRFIGTYTNGHESIQMGGVTFHGREPSDVPEGDLLRRIMNNPEFEAVKPKTLKTAE